MILTVLICFAVCYQAVRASSAPIVDLGYAKYRGAHEVKWDLDVYQGIPYGKIPKRWWKAKALSKKEPYAKKALKGVQDATKQPPMCVQFGEEGMRLKELYGNEQEACLFLNVYTPASRTKKSLPVLVWIHGGDYQYGRADADPRILMQSNNNSFIFVDIQYRLGVLGFLSFNVWQNRQKTGGWNNVGLLDQRLALRWVRKHIRKFGGDPKRVTLGGHGSGAGSVILQSMAADGKGEVLFRNAIIASPFLPPVHAYDSDAHDQLYQLSAESWKATANRHKHFLAKDWTQLSRAQDRMKKRPIEHPNDRTLANAGFSQFKLALKCGRKSDLAQKVGDGECLRKRTLTVIRKEANRLTSEMGHLDGTLLFMPVKEGRGRIGRVPEIGSQWGLLRDFPSSHMSNALDGLIPKNILVGTSHQDGIPLALQKHSRLSGDKNDFKDWFKKNFVRRYSYGFDSMDWEERDLIEQMYNASVTWDDKHFFYDNSNSLAKGSPELMDRFPIMCYEEKKWSPRQPMVNRILTEVFYHCPAEWTAGSLAGPSTKKWRYEIRHEQNFAGDDLPMILPPSDKFDAFNETWATRIDLMYSLQRMWGNFITQDSPVISIEDARRGSESAQVPIDPDSKGKKLHWPEYPWMMVLDSDGGQTHMRRPPGLDFKCPTRLEADRNPITNHFSLANSATWNDNRAARCGWWQEHGHQIPL